MRKLLVLLLLGLLIVGGLISSSCASMEVEVGPLLIKTSEIVAGQAFAVEASVMNIGENDGTFTASIRLDEKVFDKKKVRIAAGDTEIILFDCIVETPGTHTLKLNDSSTVFTALKPADFEVTFLSIPSEVYMRGTIVIEVNVTNIGEVEGIYNARLMVNGTETASEDVMLAPGAIETISFTMTIDIPGTYNISLDEATATLAVFLAFPDPNLEAVIRENLNKPEGPIYMADMETIIILEAQDRDISDLTGLEFCTNLQELQLSQNNISDLSPVASLTKLVVLDLGSYQYESSMLLGNNISDISPLAGLTNLEELWLADNNISDISVLAGLTGLQELQLSQNNISDLSPLAGLTNLVNLELIGNNISDISPLAGHTNLEHLRFDNNNISDISVLAGLTNLIELGLGYNNIGDSGISLVAGLTNLQDLRFGNSNISDISFVTGLTNLLVLHFYENNISDISPLAGLTNLYELHFYKNNISDISVLAGLTNLYELSLGGNNISDISPLVANSGLAEGDFIGLFPNPLSTTSINIYVPQLEERGVVFPH